MTSIHAVLGIAVVAVNAAAGLWGAWLWWRVEAQPAFWPLLRAGQALVVVQVLTGGATLAVGGEPPELHLLYGLLPVPVAFVAEQLRLVAAEQVLDRRGLAQAREMERLPAHQQRVIVLEIVRRETGVMAASALVIALLALRASGAAGGLPL